MHHHETGHWRRPTLLLAVITLVIGLLHGKLLDRAQQRMGLRVSDTGIRFGATRFRRFQATWDQIAGIRFSESRAVIALKHGPERVLDLADLNNGAQVREVLEGAQTEADRASRNRGASQRTCSTTFPVISPASRRRCASAASASGNHGINPRFHATRHQEAATPRVRAPAQWRLSPWPSECGAWTP